MENQKQNTVKVCTNISTPDQKIADAREVLSRSICLKSITCSFQYLDRYVFSFSFCGTANHEIVRINSAVFQNKKKQTKIFNAACISFSKFRVFLKCLPTFFLNVYLLS